MTINRRELLKSSIALSGFFSLANLDAIAENLSADKPQTHAEGLLKDKNFLTLTQITEIIMPRTDTPGAIDAGVAETMNQVFASTLTLADLEKLQQGFIGLDDLCNTLYKKSFLNLSLTQQTELIKTLNINFTRAGSPQAELIKKYSAKTEHLNSVQRSIDFFGMVKYFTLLIFFRSQPGATQVLQYVAIPGRYQANAPLKEIGKTWATN